MFELIAEILIYLIVAAILGLILGYLIWGWGRRRAIAAARASGAAAVRTSVDGDSSLRSQLEACSRSNARLEESAERHRARIAELEEALAGQERAQPVVKPAPVAAVAVQAPAPVAEPEPEPDPPQAPDSSGIAEIRSNDAFSRRLAGLGTEDEEARDDAEPIAETEEAPEPALSAPDDSASSEAAPDAGDVTVMEPQEPAPVPASLLDERPDEVDDLKRIKGVGPIMEQVLNEKGVYLFRQLANFSTSDIAWVNSAIDAFPGRIERDNWVAQAQQLYREKYGRAHDEPD